ncbi:response regulator transcription factor [Nocardia sp. CDC159]|uniref:Response regulator transcription factor n=1 Tax=Nocardia pulmonis TaxID=2951408 RepID=A0A9X2J0X0_9NOCA|nr:MULTISPECIES: response regulator transcription factor [Nocardia]MCM6778269.1 response regulator transcription factor [Nocardia pulmonis]MCM6791158.1 response regulator transcription factor [Nocardia sp. CDC159]
MLHPRLLVVADCEGREDTVIDLRRHGFDPESVTTGAEALASYPEFDVVLVDLEFSEFDGLTLCREIRNASDIPLIGFASYELDRVLALEAGCDDCVVKPYHSRELMARLRAVLRRVHMMTQPTLIAGQLEINSSLREVRLDGRLIELTRKEFELLRLLAAEPHRVFSRAELLHRVWGYTEVDAEVTSLASRTIDTHLSSIRKKLGSPHWIVTVHSIGFRFNDAAMRGKPVHAAEAARASGRAG